MLSKAVISSAVFVGFVNAAAIGRRQDFSSASFPVPSSVVPSSVSTPIPGPTDVPAGCPSVVLPLTNGTDFVNGTNSIDGTDPDINDPIIFDGDDGSDFNSTSTLNSTTAYNLTTVNSTDVNSTDTDPTDTNTDEGETWGQWGTNIGNYYANLYPTPDSVPGLSLYERSPAPETWAEWGQNIGDYWANRYASPDDVPGLPQYKRGPSPFSIGVASDFSNLFGDYYGNKYRRAPAPETWAEWGENVGNYWANQYASPDDVPGLVQYKRAPFSIGNPSDFGNLFGDYYGNKYKRDIQPADAIASIRNLQIDVQTQMINEGKGDNLLNVIGQLESLVAQATVPGADLTSIVNQAQDIVNNA